MRVPTIAASSTTSTVRESSRSVPLSMAVRRLAAVWLRMPEPSSSSRAARAASEVPITRCPLASKAARTASRANVLPAPARPTTNCTASPDWVRLRIISRCSSLSEGRAARAASTTAASTTADAPPRPATAAATVDRSSSRISGVVQIRPSTSSTAWADDRYSSTLASIWSRVAPWVAPVATLRTMSPRVK